MVLTQIATAERLPDLIMLRSNIISTVNKTTTQTIYASSDISPLPSLSYKANGKPMKPPRGGVPILRHVPLIRRLPFLGHRPGYHIQMLQYREAKRSFNNERRSNGSMKMAPVPEGYMMLKECSS